MPSTALPGDHRAGLVADEQHLIAAKTACIKALNARRVP